MRPPERFTVFAAFHSAPNAEEIVPAWQSHGRAPSPWGEGWGEGGRFPTTMKRCALDRVKECALKLPVGFETGVLRIGREELPRGSFGWHRPG